MKKYKLKQAYPGLPENWKAGTEVIRYAPIFGFAYYSDLFDKHHLRKEDVESNPDYFEEV